MKERYKEAKRAAKKTVTEAKNQAFEAFYQKPETREGEQYIYKLVKSRSRQKKDLGTVKFIKDEGGRVLTSGKKAIGCGFSVYATNI